MARPVKSRLLTRRVGPLIIVRQSREEPRPTEWSNLMTILGEALGEGVAIKGLVVTDGGGPDASQRAALKEVMRGKSVRTAVVSDSLKLRFVSAGVALFNPGHRAFSRADLLQAYKYLELTDVERRFAEKALVEMAAHLLG